MPSSFTRRWCGVNKPEPFPLWTEKCGKAVASCAQLSALTVSKPAHTHSLRVDISSPPVCLSRFPIRQKGLSPPHRTPGLGWPDRGSPSSLPRVRVCLCTSSVPCRSLSGAKSQPHAFFFHPTHLHGDLSCSFGGTGVLPVSLVFHENCSTCKCAFEVFFRGG